MYESAIAKMPYLSRKVLVSLCPFVNLDLFRRGHYHVSCCLKDKEAEQLCSKVTGLEVKDSLSSDAIYPGACMVEGSRFLSQTAQVEFSEQSFVFGETFVFSSEAPILRDYTEAYVPSRFSLQLSLMFSGEEDLPKCPSEFKAVSSRTVSLEVDWRKGLHEHFPVIFDYFHLAAIGVSVHASLCELSLERFVPAAGPAPAVTPSRRWFQSQPPPPPSLQCPNMAAILFGEPLSSSSSPSSSSSLASTPERRSVYQVPVNAILRAQEAHQMLCDILNAARDSLTISQAIMSGELGSTPHAATTQATVSSSSSSSPSSSDVQSVDPSRVGSSTSLNEAVEISQQQIRTLNASLMQRWEEFTRLVICEPTILEYIMFRCLQAKISYVAQSLVAPYTQVFRMVSDITDPVCQASVAATIRKGLRIPLTMYCTENVENHLNCSVLFIEPCPWPSNAEPSQCLSNITGDVGVPEFTMSVRPYFMDALPHRRQGGRPQEVHLVICLHGLQGNQYDLRLYQVYLQLALPHVRFDFMMAQSNHSDTFCDFNLMTDRVLEEVLQYVVTMPTPPHKISFIGHSLGNIVVRSLVTRPEFSHLLPKLHLFLSICGPHLGTQQQNTVISTGMWVIQRWYSSKSLLQLSLRDAPNPRDSFLYHLSETPTFEHFRHVVLLTSPQDKYVPYHSAKLVSLSRDGSLQSNLSLEMMHRILEGMREARVNLVRVSVDYALPVSTNSMIGRAAHITMLDSELFIEKFVLLHLMQYFVQPN